MNTVLVAEDEYALQSVLAMTLEGSGYAVRRAGDGEQALQILRQGGVHLVVADSTMLGMGGRQLFAEMQSSPALRAIPFILMIASHEPQSGIGVPTLKKPFGMGALLDAVRTALTPKRVRARACDGRRGRGPRPRSAA